MRKLKNIALAMVILVFTGIIFSYSLYRYKLLPVSDNDELKIIEIKSGASAYDIGKLLEDNNLIKSSLFFRIYLKLNGDKNLQAGFYELSENMGVEKIIEKISSGDAVNPNAFSITFPEGKNFRYIAKTIASKTNNTEEEVYALVKDEAYLNELINKYWFLTDDIKNKNIYYALEGYLFPDTYIIENKDIDVKDIFTQMLNQTDKILSKYKADILESKYSIHELMTLASIIEMEGVGDEDRAIMAGVFYNRLEIGMNFGSCATACYAAKFDGVCKPANVLTNYNSPYNTYLPSTAGKLTPGPIGLPGEESIKAILYPDENNFLFFVSDKNGKTYFAKTNQEHEANKRKIKNEGNWIE